MVCTFIGHHDAPRALEDDLKKEIERQIAEGVLDFVVGNNGSFDFLSQCALRAISRENPKIRFSIVLSRIDEHAISGAQDATVFPEGLELSLPRFAICKRNRWLLENAQIVIAYVAHTTSNAHRWLERARKKGLRVINLAK